MQPDDPLFNHRTVVKALVVALLSGAVLACTLYSPYVGIYWRIALAVAALMVTVFAANTDLHLSSGPPAVMNVQRAENVTQNNPPAPPEPPPAPPPGDRPAIG